MNLDKNPYKIKVISTNKTTPKRLKINLLSESNFSGIKSNGIIELLESPLLSVLFYFSYSKIIFRVVEPIAINNEKR